MPLLCSFFFNDTATPEIYTLSLHDALPISVADLAAIELHGGFPRAPLPDAPALALAAAGLAQRGAGESRSEEHTSELQSLRHLVCRLLLEKKKKTVTKG